jgi:hypothetical protein
MRSERILKYCPVTFSTFIQILFKDWYNQYTVPNTLTVKPNADLGIITSTAKEGIKNLTNNDVLILCGILGILGKMIPQKGSIISHNSLTAAEVQM